MEHDINVVLAAYADAAAAPGGTRLEDWVQRYPGHGKALVRYAMHSCILENGRPRDTPAAADELEARFLTIGVAARERIMDQVRQAGRPPRRAAIAGLFKAAQAAGLDPRSLADRLSLGRSLLTRLDRRLIRAETVPRALVARLAEALQRPAADVVAYLRLPPTLSANASYRSAAAPRLVRESVARDELAMMLPAVEPPAPPGVAQDFATVLRQSADMTDEQKQHWLSVAADTLDAEA